MVVLGIICAIVWFMAICSIFKVNINWKYRDFEFIVKTTENK